MNIEGKIKLDSKEYSYKIRKSKVNKRIICRYYDDILHISAPFNLSNTQVLERTLNIKDSIIKLINLSKKKKVSFERYDEISFFGNKYLIVYADKTAIKEQVIYLNKDNPEESYYKLAKKYGMIYFKQRIDYFLSIIEPRLEVKELKIRTMKSIYGDCYTKRKIITLNTKLAYFTLEQIDSVIVHELIHLIHPDHSKQFYAKVLEYCPNYYRLKKEMDEVTIR